VQYTHTPFSLFIDYVQQHNIEFLIGRSHGGFMAYWLSEALGIPCLAINPHLSLRNKERMRPKEAVEKKSPLCLVVVGTDDQLVDADRTLEYFAHEDQINPSVNRKIKVIDGIGHWLTIDMYTDLVAWALDEITRIPTLPSNH